MKKSVKEISELSGVSIRTLQYYDEEKILIPKRNALNHRVYEDDDIRKLWKICILKKTGMPLKQIRIFIEDEKKALEIIGRHKRKLYHQVIINIGRLILLEIDEEKWESIPEGDFTQAIDKMVKKTIKGVENEN